MDGDVRAPKGQVSRDVLQMYPACGGELGFNPLKKRGGLQETVIGIDHGNQAVTTGVKQEQILP